MTNTLWLCFFVRSVWIRTSCFLISFGWKQRSALYLAGGEHYKDWFKFKRQFLPDHLSHRASFVEWIILVHRRDMTPRKSLFRHASIGSTRARASNLRKVLVGPCTEWNARDWWRRNTKWAVNSTSDFRFVRKLQIIFPTGGRSTERTKTAILPRLINTLMSDIIVECLKSNLTEKDRTILLLIPAQLINHFFHINNFYFPGTLNNFTEHCHIVMNNIHIKTLFFHWFDM